MQTLTFSTLFPNPQMPTHGIFVARRLGQLLGSGQLSSQIVAPVPWFPFKHPRFGHYGRFAQVPRQSLFAGGPVYHPRYPLLPKVGMSSAPLSLAIACYPLVKRLVAEQNIQLIDAHYMYPDGVAATLLGKWLGLPVVITSRGTDINLIPQHTIPRRWIQWAAGQAAGLVTVCAALKESLVALGVAPERISVLRNGVDLDFFHPAPSHDDRQLLRQTLKLNRHTLLSVGHLIPRKGHEIVVQALHQLQQHNALPETELIICGDGPEKGALESLIDQQGLKERVRMTGALPPEQLRDYYRAADGLVLASSREGWANVLLEAMACGTPVIASDVWGTPEVVQNATAGQLFSPRTPQALVDALIALHQERPSREETRRYAEGFSWQATTDGQLALFQSILNATDPTGRAP
uniref:Putative GT4 n=1 Tax=Magnetococcus massalia (strain MO-1) TaxID=451514 RepID=A0A1S7LQL2_MAGMO|nr:Putative GT4 [Candidatus Magnetococcus massalia]